MSNTEAPRLIFSEAVHPQLAGHTVLVIESPILAENYADACVKEQRMRAIPGHEVPGNLIDLMDERGIESAIMHVSAEFEESPTIIAHNAGKKIVILRRRFPITHRDTEMNARLDALGIPYALKTVDLSGFNRALVILAGLFGMQEAPKE